MNALPSLAELTLDVSILAPLMLVLVCLAAFAAFDFYAFSPRPSGLTLRSRKLAPVIIIGIAMLLTGFSLLKGPARTTNEQIQSGANYSPRTVQMDRSRLVTYPTVVENEFQSVLFGLTLLGSGFFFASRFGLLGWTLLVGTISLSIGVAHVQSDPTGIHFGPAELCFGLTAACAMLLRLEQPRKKRRRIGRLERRQPNGRHDRRETRRQEQRLAVGMLAATAAATLAQMFFKHQVRFELVGLAILVGCAVTHHLRFVAKLSGPHWEATTLQVISSLGILIVAGFALFLSPRGFDRVQWVQNVFQMRRSIATEISSTAQAAYYGANRSAAERELQFSIKLERKGNEVRHAIAAAEEEGAKVLTANDKRLLSDLRTLYRMLLVLERLHRSRASVLDADQRTSVSRRIASESVNLDPLGNFWNQQLPWIESEFVLLQNFSNSAKNDRQRLTTNFVTGLDRDLEKLTFAALDVEVRRIEGWLSWAEHRPRNEASTVKATAADQAARLQTIVTQIANGPSATSVMMERPLRRLQVADRRLQRLASSPYESNW